MKILYLNPSGKLGGAETSLLTLLGALRRSKPEWQLHAILTEAGPLVQRLRELDVVVEVLPLPEALAQTGDSTGTKATGSRVAKWARTARVLPAALAYRTALAAAIAGIRPDLLHTNGFKMHLLAPWAKAGQPLVMHLHDYVSTRPVAGQLLRWSIHRAATVVTNSCSVAEDVQAQLSPRTLVVPIHNAVDLARFTAEGPRMDVDEKSGLPPAKSGTVRIGLVATFAHWKGHLTFLKAISKLPDSPAFRAYIIGGPIYSTPNSQHSLDGLKREAARLGVEDKVGFTGFAEDVPQAIRALDIVVHASTEPEPFGMVIIEAMACGKPVVAARAGGSKEIFDHGVTALGHRPGDANELAHQISRLVSSSSLREEISMQGRAAVLSRFPAQRMAGEFIKLYQTLAAGASNETQARTHARAPA